MNRRELLRTGLMLPGIAGLVGLGGCFGGKGSPHTWWELDPQRNAALLVSASAGVPGSVSGSGSTSAVQVASFDPRRAKLSLVVEGVAASPLYEGTALVYSRGAGMRANYQYASWTEPPAQRLARLVQRRLQQREGFGQVAVTDSGITPDVLLTLTLEQLYHDVPANEVELSLTAMLIEWNTRKPMASRAFSQREATPTVDAAGAVAAADRAVARLLDELVPWVEGAAAPPRRVVSPAGRTGAR